MYKRSMCLIVACLVSTLVYFMFLNMNDGSSTRPYSPGKKFEDAKNARKKGMNTQQPDTTPGDRLNKVIKVGRSYKILWYNPPMYVRNFPGTINVGFSECKFSNCELSYNKSDSKVSDAIIFDGRTMNGRPPERPVGQVWIFAAHEAPISYNDPNRGKWKSAPWRYSYNWTMAYNMFNTDIHLPYGIIKRKPFPAKRNYTYIASKQNDSVLMISSHCHTRSKRHEYVDELRKYIPVTILGACGTRWKCGRHYVHDKCFDLLNTTFKFYLAFENALCTQYFSEKWFENFNYDIILVVRGGNKTEEPSSFPNGTYISAQSFDSAKDLGIYLKKLSESTEAYAEMLERKIMFYSPGYKEVYQRAMCNLCERMNFQNQYQKMIPDIEKWAFESKPCIKL